MRQVWFFILFVTFFLGVDASCDVVENKSDKGKIHLGVVLSIITQERCQLNHCDKPQFPWVPLRRMAECLLSKELYFFPENMFPMFKKYFCEKFYGLESFVTKEGELIKRKMESVKKDLVFSEYTWHRSLLKNTGEKFFKVKAGTPFDSRSYYMKLKPGSLKKLLDKTKVFKV